MNNKKQALFASGSWRSIVGIFLFGVLGAVSVSKLIPLGERIQTEFNTGPTEFGLLISLIGIVAAIVALPSGLVVDRFGPRAVLMAAALVGAVVNIGYFFGDSLFSFQVLRFLEGGVIVFFYTSGPAFLMATNEGARLGSAMTLWATYMPIGTTVGLFLGGFFSASEDWRAVFLVQALLFVLLIFLTLLQPKVATVQAGQALSLFDRLKGVGRAYAKPSILLLSLSFLMMISLGFGANSTLPSYMARIHGLTMSEASGMVASVTLVMVFGSLANGVLMARGWKPYWLFISFALLGTVFGSLAFFPAFSVSVQLLMVAAWLFVSGAATAGLMSMMPLVAEPSERASAAALVNQAGALATFITPPIWLSFAAGGSWLPFAYMMVLGLLLAAFLVFCIFRRVS